MTCTERIEHTALRTSLVAAAKAHQCSTCADIIPRGDEHTYQVLVLDGRFVTERTCGYCWDRQH